MEKWQGKVAVVTGASAGIGAAVCVALASAGVRVVGLARRPQLVDNLQNAVTGKGSIVSRQCDVSSPEELTATFKWIDEKFGCVHVLVNNAGVLHEGQITDVGNKPLSEADIISTIDLNLKGPILCTKHVVASMKRNGFDGHIITINSIAGDYVPLMSNFNVYPSTKHGVTTFHTTLASEFAHFKSKIKTTSVSPGLVMTDMASQLIPKDGSQIPALAPKDIADAVVYALSTPANVNIEELTVTPVAGVRL